jgi:hypothetical protein
LKSGHVLWGYVRGGQRHKMPMADIQSLLIDHGELLRWLRARAITLYTVITGSFDDFEIGKAEEFVEIFDLIHLVFRKGNPSTLGDDQQPFMDTTIGEGHTVFLSVIRQSTPSLRSPVDSMGAPRTCL